jgi:hypothetical protein
MNDWENYNYGSGNFGGEDRLDLENLPDVFGSAGTPRDLLYSNAAYGPGMTGDQTSRYDTILNLTGSKDLANIAASGGFSDLLKNFGGAASNLGSSRMGMAGIAALLALLDRREKEGGGVAQAYAGPKSITRTMTQGKYGPIVQAYAQGGKVQMEDGGFVMTKRAVDGAGGPRGIQQLVPGARMIQGPGTGTSDDIPAVINGRNGQTPARLSNGEAYVPKPFVDRIGGARQMYALMNKLQRRA